MFLLYMFISCWFSMRYFNFSHLSCTYLPHVVQMLSRLIVFGIRDIWSYDFRIIRPQLGQLAFKHCLLSEHFCSVWKQSVDPFEVDSRLLQRL